MAALPFADLFGKLRELENRMAQLQAELERKTTTVEVGGGMVRITASAAGKIHRISIDPAVLSEGDILEDLLTAGVNKAIEEARKLAQEETARLTAELLPPGFKLPGW
jgi:DNA-binding YbaB/EbfC family protein|nr:MAG: hypothetical protein KatS3mg041_0641 [Bacteroidota bacterium]